jgi:predicted restriction endonuclease
MKIITEAKSYVARTIISRESSETKGISTDDIEFVKKICNADVTFNAGIVQRLEKIKTEFHKFWNSENDKLRQKQRNSSSWSWKNNGVWDCQMQGCIDTLIYVYKLEWCIIHKPTSIQAWVDSLEDEGFGKI